jgi:hypothetical protein
VRRATRETEAALPDRVRPRDIPQSLEEDDIGRKSKVEARARGALRAARRTVFASSAAALLALVALAALAGGEADALSQAAPVNTSEPTVSGSPVQGSVLTASPGAWSGTVTSFAFQWRRCGTDGGQPDASNCGVISGATSTTYTLTGADVGFRLRIVVTATNGNDSPATMQDAASNPTDTVTPTSAAAPVNTGEPAVSGTPAQGQKLTGTNGTWTGTAPIGYAFQWVRCGTDGGLPDGSNCASIGGATGTTYTLGSDDVGKRIRLRVTATNSAGTQTAASNATDVVTGGNAPRATAEPRISGTSQQGKTLATTAGTWSGSGPITFAFQWRRCGTDGGRADASNCAVIPGATRNVYVLTPADVNRRLRVRVTATNSAGSSTSTSNPTATVKAPAPAGPAGAIKLPTGKTSIPVTSVSLPNRLIIDKVQFSPNPVRTRTQPFVMRVHVSDTRGYVIRDALVFVRSTPILTNPAPEARTAQDGWITFNILPKASFPIRTGYNVQFFVRARKPGGNILAGVSTRRLVQVRTANG